MSNTKTRKAAAKKNTRKAPIKKTRTPARRARKLTVRAITPRTLSKEDLLKLARLTYGHFKDAEFSFEHIAIDDRDIIGSMVAFDRLNLWAQGYLIKHDPKAVFDLLSPEQKRVTIARDVIEQLDLRNIIPLSGTYLAHHPTKSLELTGDEEVGDVLTQQPKCSACALGSLFVATAKRADKLKVRAVQDAMWATSKVRPDNDSMFAYLKDFFSEEQLSLIESAFERNTHGDNWRPSIKFGDVVMGKKYNRESGAQAEKVMRAIMKNIIKHKGDFVPPAAARGGSHDIRC